MSEGGLPRRLHRKAAIRYNQKSLKRLLHIHAAHFMRTLCLRQTIFQLINSHVISSSWETRMEGSRFTVKRLPHQIMTLSRPNTWVSTRFPKKWQSFSKQSIETLQVKCIELVNGNLIYPWDWRENSTKHVVGYSCVSSSQTQKRKEKKRMSGVITFECVTQKVSDHHLHHAGQWIAAITPHLLHQLPTMGCKPISSDLLRT